MSRGFRPLLTLLLLAGLAWWHVPLTALPQQPAPAKPASSATPVARPATPAAVSAQKLKREGLPNLGKVNDRLYRSGQPKEQGFEAIRDLGVNIVVNLRDDAVKDEQRQVESRGMRYVQIPWHGTAPADSRQVAEFLQLLRDNPGEKILVHCHRGAERTGVMIAAYRMAEQGWTPERALDEMEEFKFLGFWFRHLKQYVREFPQTLQTDPAFRQFRPSEPVPQ